MTTDSSSGTDPHAAIGVVSGSEAVRIALDLGWEMTDLYCEARVRGRDPQRGADLPTLSDLVLWQTTELRLARTAASIHRLQSAAGGAGATLPQLDSIVTAFGAQDNEALKTTIYELHLELLRTLHAVSANLGKAFDLGRSLAYTCRRPTDGTGLREEFQRYRLATLQDWLADLSSVLPDHAARAVAISLELWQRCVPDPKAAARRWQLTDEELETTLPLLHRQAKVWRAVLTGEKNGRDMLGPQDYIHAAGRLLGRTLRLAWTFNWRTAFAVPIVLAGGAVGVWAILTSGGQTGAKIVGALTTAAAAVGISWASTKATLGQLAVKLEQPLWHAELDAAIGSAVTTLDRKRATPRLATIAAEIPPQGAARTSSIAESADAKLAGSLPVPPANGR